MAKTNKSLAKVIASRVDLKTIKVGDRVKFLKTVGVVVSLPTDRANGYGAIRWGNDAEPTESNLSSWKTLRRVSD